jgi:xylulokinase
MHALVSSYLCRNNAFNSKLLNENYPTYVMASYDPLYLGFDLSTQQLKAVAVTSDLKVACEVKFDFDVDSRDFGVEHGVLTNDGEHEVYAPVVMWLQAVDRVLEQLQKSKGDFRRIGGISGAGQQHGSVYWNAEGERVLQNLDPTKSYRHSSSRHLVPL